MYGNWSGSTDVADFLVRQTAGGKLEQKANQLGRFVSEDVTGLGGQL